VLEEHEALRLVEVAVERAGGARNIVASPRHPFAMNAEEEHEVDGHVVTIHFSEQSSPAIASVAGWIFEIREREYLMLQKPRPPKQS
jgi:hypothetical protein